MNYRFPEPATEHAARVAVIDAGRPRNSPAAHMQGFLSRDGTPPAELLAIGRQEIASYGVDIIDDWVVDASPDLAITLAGECTLHARCVLVATGVSDELPDIAGVRERWGRDLLHCPYCHGWEVRDRPLGVLGTIPGSVDHALLVRQWSNDVVFFQHTYRLADDERRQLAARGIAIEPGAVTRLVIEHDALTGVELEGERTVPRAAVFIRPGNIPHRDGLASALGYNTNDAGFPIVDPTGRTTNPNVWAAGNAVDPRAQVITSAGAGSAAAIAINADLVRADVDLALGETLEPTAH